MAEQTIKLPRYYSQSEMTEVTLRTKGAWCSNGGKTARNHYFKAKNPSINTAISLCGSVIAPINKLLIIQPVNECMMCKLYAPPEGSEPKAHIIK